MVRPRSRDMRRARDAQRARRAERAQLVFDPGFFEPGHLSKGRGRLTYEGWKRAIRRLNTKSLLFSIASVLHTPCRRLLSRAARMRFISLHGKYINPLSAAEKVLITEVYLTVGIGTVIGAGGWFPSSVCLQIVCLLFVCLPVLFSLASSVSVFFVSVVSFFLCFVPIHQNKQNLIFLVALSFSIFLFPFAFHAFFDTFYRYHHYIHIITFIISSLVLLLASLQ